MHKRFVLLLLLTGLLFFDLQARTTLVRDAAEINALLNTLQPGDTLLMKSGFWKDQRIVIKGEGTEEQPIVLKAEIPGKVWLTGKSNLRISGQYVVVDGLYFVNGYSPDGAVVEFRYGSKWANHCRLTNSAIVDYNPSSKSNDYKWVSLYGQYNRVDHCYFAGKTNSGTTLVVWLATKPNYHRIDHNHFGPRPDLGYNGGETIRIGTSDYSMYDSYTTVEWNYFEHCDGEIEIISNKSCKNTYRYNTFDECQGTLTLRHGNACDVYANFFFGHKNGRSGGVRIIGEDHRVYNNYFQDLNGSDYRAAISMMNGVPNSPLNRYFQVKRAQVLFNTIVNCYQPFVIGAGKDAEKTLPPLDCIIADNVVSTSVSSQIVTLEDQPINLTWQGNIFYGAELGFADTGGVKLEDPLLQLAADGLYRPAEGSPVLGAAQGAFDFVSSDMDGQPRTEPKDVGADQKSSDPVAVFPLQPGDVGPEWYPPEPPPIPVIYVQAGKDSLKNALSKAEDGEIIELITDAGVYTVSSSLTISKNVTIRGREGLNEQPVITVDAEVDSLNSLFYWASAKVLTLRNLKIDGQNKISYIFKNEKKHAALKCDSLVIQNSGQNADGAVFVGLPGSMADSLVFNGVSFYHGLGRGLVANQEAENSGLYNVNRLTMENCTAWDFPYSFIDVYGGDNIPFTSSPQIFVNHCTFYDCATESGLVINAREADFTIVKNSIFTLSNEEQPVLALYGLTALVDYCDFYQTGPVLLERSAVQGNHIWQMDPQFEDPEHGNLGLKETSYFWGKADDGYPLGDLRWTGKVMALEEAVPTLNPTYYLMVQNYPNPFNGQTTIKIKANQSGVLDWAIVDASGRLIQRGQKKVIAGQPNTFNWQADHLASGVYFFRAKLQNVMKVRKLLLMR